VNRVEKYLYAGGMLLDQFRCGEPVQIRHADIENDHVRAEGPGFFDSLVAIDRLSADFPILARLKQRAQTTPHYFVIVSEQNTHAQRKLCWAGVCVHTLKTLREPDPVPLTTIQLGRMH